jgi:hypothetical protein
MAQKHSIKEAFTRAREKLFGKSKAQREKDRIEERKKEMKKRDAATEGLLDAAEKGDIKKVEYWLAHGADANGEDIYNVLHDTPLMGAAQNGHIEICELLLERGAEPGDVNASDIDALTFAAKKGYARICLLLVRKGAIPLIKEPEWDEIPPVMQQFSQFREHNPISQKQLDALIAMQEFVGHDAFDSFLENFEICINKK